MDKKQEEDHIEIQDVLSKFEKMVGSLGQRFVYIFLLLYFAFRRSDTPRWAKNIVIGAFAYFLSPIDSIPDLTPFMGYTDDLGVMSFALVTIACYVNDDVKDKAKTKLSKVFKKVDESTVGAVDAKL